MALNIVGSVPRVAVAAALRKLWLEGGVFSPEPEQVTDLFRGALKAPEILMTPDEIAALGEFQKACEFFEDNFMAIRQINPVA